jgi:hypothetical protein
MGDNMDDGEVGAKPKRKEDGEYHPELPAVNRFFVGRGFRDGVGPKSFVLIVTIG